MKVKRVWVKAPRCRMHKVLHANWNPNRTKNAIWMLKKSSRNARQQNDANDAHDASDLGLAAMQGNNEVLTKGALCVVRKTREGVCMGEFGWEICMGEEEGRESLFTMGGRGGQRASDCVCARPCVLKVLKVGSVWRNAGVGVATLIDTVKSDVPSRRQSQSQSQSQCPPSFTPPVEEVHVTCKPSRYLGWKGTEH